ncbi:hypothetical protein CI238_06793 [Colletotrichum incanum]|uniref:Uncharacterized protein n=1 Tax=Colletotrichum incanum TaxID=1573173 RepID=A0A167DVT0_COLIC|nr:hypothetical protein CI238_06793 [Colletotrichum incanum]OHW97766.1 hypothetical protein CSPAE12_03528 [Colletotrichum incanum]
MGPKEVQEKLSFNLVCRYYATPGETQQCLISLRNYLELEKHQKRLSAWKLLATGFRTNGPNILEGAVRIVILEVRFTHKWMTLENLGFARCTFSNTVHVVQEIMSGLAKASIQERGTLDWSKMFSYGCNPHCEVGCKRDWGIEAVSYYCHPREQAGPNGSAQKAIQELLIKYMEIPDLLRGMKVSSSSSCRALEEACKRIDSADGNTRPLWNALYSTSVLDCDPLQLDVDLAVFTMKKVVRWYDELLALFKVAVQFEDIVSRVNKAADLGGSLPTALKDEKNDADDGSMMYDSEQTLCGEKDRGLDKVTVVEIEDAYKPVGDGVDNQQPRKRNWWRIVVNSIGVKVRCSKREPWLTNTAAQLKERSLEIKRAHAELGESVVEFAAQVDQLRVLARGFILLTKMQTKWAQVQAMAKRPGVDMAEVNKVTMVNLAELSCYTRRAKTLSNWANKVKEANRAMMQDAASIVQRSNQLENDLYDFFKDHRRHQGRFVGFGACQKCFA